MYIKYLLWNYWYAFASLIFDVGRSTSEFKKTYPFYRCVHLKYNIIKDCGRDCMYLYKCKRIAFTRLVSIIECNEYRYSWYLEDYEENEKLKNLKGPKASSIQPAEVTVELTRSVEDELFIKAYASVYNE